MQSFSLENEAFGLEQEAWWLILLNDNSSSQPSTLKK